MSDTSKTEADFANILNEAFGRGSIHAELENSDYLSHHLKADEKMAAYREWRDAKARELAAVTAERDALRRAHDAVLALINDSRGVVGLHLNGDEASWDELRTGGRFEEWLSPFDAALSGKDGAK